MRAASSRWMRARAWLSRAALGASILALLGTSRASWTVAAPSVAEAGAPSAGTALRVTVDASHEPLINYDNRFGTFVELASARGRSETPTKASHLLPPGATVHSITIRGNDCASGGVCSKCAPPPGAFVRATTEAVHIWTKVDTLETKLSAEASSTLPHIEVLVTGDPRTFDVVIRGKTDQDRLNGWKGTPVQARCSMPADAGTGEITCEYWAFSELPTKHVEADAVVDVTSFGECPDPRRPCAPPEDAGARLRSVTVKN